MRRNRTLWLRAFIAVAVLGIGTGARAQSKPHKPADTQPSEPTPLHNEIVDKYMTGDWDSLETEITQKQKDISALPKDQFADVKYIVQALNECHPLWWKQTRTGGQGTLRANVWQRNVTVQFEPGGEPKFNYLAKGNEVTITLNWPSAQMESDAPLGQGYTKADMINEQVWGLIEQASLYDLLPAQRVTQIKGAEKTALDRFVYFRQGTTAAYYGTPRARQREILLSLDAFSGSHQNDLQYIARKPLGAMFIAEVVEHPKQYPDLKLPDSVDTDTAESKLATDLLRQLSSVHLNFDEDKALREALWRFGTVNGTGVYNTGRISFANNQIMGIDPFQDPQVLPRRNKWLADAIVAAAKAAATQKSDTDGKSAE